MFFAPKIYTLIHIPASETSRPLATYVARVCPHDFVARNYLLALKRSTCGKTTHNCKRFRVKNHSCLGILKLSSSMYINVQTNDIVNEPNIYQAVLNIFSIFNLPVAQ